MTFFFAFHALSYELFYFISVASTHARTLVAVGTRAVLGERKPSWHREATTPNRQHRKDLEDTDKTDEQKMGNLDTEDEDLLLISPEAGLLSSRSSNLPRLDSRLMEHHHVPLPSLTRPHPTHF